MVREAEPSLLEVLHAKAIPSLRSFDHKSRGERRCEEKVSEKRRRNMQVRSKGHSSSLIEMCFLSKVWGHSFQRVLNFS